MAENGTLGPHVFCPACSYNLCGAPGDKCPECGHPLANLRTDQCQLPWTRRRTLGRLRAYGQTAWIITFRPLRFHEEHAHHVTLQDARRFQLATVALVYLPVLIATLLIYANTTVNLEVGNPMQQMLNTGTFPKGPSLLERAYAEVWPVIILHLGCLLFLYAATSAPTYFFEPPDMPEQQQRTLMALSLYAAAPLAYFAVLSLFLPLLATLIALLEGHHIRPFVPSMWPIGFLLPLTGLCVIVYWRGLLRLARKTMPHRRPRQAAIALLLPAVWIGFAFVFLVALPFLVLYILIVIASLTA